MAGEQNLADQLKKAFGEMSATQKAMVAAISLTVLLVLAGLGFWASQESMAVLVNNVTAEDANAIVETLKKAQVKYEITGDQKTILVPEGKVSELRLQLAGQGLVGGETKFGFEKLENPSLTATDFNQKVIYRRAMERELATTLKKGLSQVIADATVHITPANDSPFAVEKEDAKASVLLKLRGRALPDENTQGIVNLLAASVEGLKPDNVVVIDQYSRILSRTGKDTLAGVSESQKKVRQEEEEQLVRRVTELLEPVVGVGKVRATAHMDLDFDKVKLNEERFNPQEQVERSVQTKEEKIQKRDAGAGVPGTPSNVAPANGGAAAGGANESTERKESTTNYEISKTVRAVEQAPGGIKRISLAVIVDDNVTWEKDAKGEPLAKNNPRTPDEMKKIRDQVEAAAGIVAQRGDTLTVENMAFAPMSNPKEEAEAKRQFWVDLLRQYLPTVIVSIFALAIFFFIFLPLLRRIGQALSRPTPLRVSPEEEFVSSAPKITPVKSMAELEAEIEAELNADAALAAPEARRRELIKKRVQESANDDPEAMAALIRTWILEDGR